MSWRLLVVVFLSIFHSRRDNYLFSLFPLPFFPSSLYLFSLLLFIFFPSSLYLFSYLFPSSLTLGAAITLFAMRLRLKRSNSCSSESRYRHKRAIVMRLACRSRHFILPPAFEKSSRLRRPRLFSPRRFRTRSWTALSGAARKWSKRTVVCSITWSSTTTSTRATVDCRRSASLSKTNRSGFPRSGSREAGREARVGKTSSAGFWVPLRRDGGRAVAGVVVIRTRAPALKKGTWNNSVRARSWIWAKKVLCAAVTASSCREFVTFSELWFFFMSQIMVH